MTQTLSTPTPDDALDIFAELPRRVQCAVLSNLQGLRSRCVLGFHDYPQHVAEYIEASGLMTVRYTQIGNNRGANFSANASTAVLKANLRTCLEMYGTEF